MKSAKPHFLVQDKNVKIKNAYYTPVWLIEVLSRYDELVTITEDLFELSRLNLTVLYGHTFIWVMEVQELFTQYITEL